VVNHVVSFVISTPILVDLADTVWEMLLSLVLCIISADPKSGFVLQKVARNTLELCFSQLQAMNKIDDKKLVQMSKTGILLKFVNSHMFKAIEEELIEDNVENHCLFKVLATRLALEREKLITKFNSVKGVTALPFTFNQIL
jgi:hypothetical protein